jgi:hypothetical protein
MKAKEKYIMGECECCGRPERVYAKPKNEDACLMCGRVEPLQKKKKILYYARVPKKPKRKLKMIRKW